MSMKFNPYRNGSEANYCYKEADRCTQAARDAIDNIEDTFETIIEQFDQCDSEREEVEQERDEALEKLDALQEQYDALNAVQQDIVPLLRQINTVSKQLISFTNNMLEQLVESENTDSSTADRGDGSAENSDSEGSQTDTPQGQPTE